MSVCQKATADKNHVVIKSGLENADVYTSSCKTKYSKILDWKNETFWNEVPNPKYNNFKNNTVIIPEIELIAKECVDSVFGDLLQNSDNFVKKQTTANEVNRKFIIRKYFNIWKTFVESEKDRRIQFERIKVQNEKLDHFMKKLKKHNKNEKIKDNNIQQIKNMTTDNKIAHKPASNYKNRFEAQKTIIEMQKAKLEEQNKVIQELKLGVINNDLQKSMEKTKICIREIFAHCSSKMKYKIPLVLEGAPNLLINTQKAPKILQKMEQRALEREENRQIILERKRLLDETRQKILEEAIENKKALEEEEKKRSLKLMKERRLKELELEKIRQINKQIFMTKFKKSVDFYNKKLLGWSLRKLKNNMQDNRNKSTIAVQFYRNNLLRKCIDTLLFVLENTYKVKYEIADAHFEYNLLKRSFLQMRNFRLESIRNMQVAEDFYDFRLTSNTFIYWNRYVCKQFMIEHKNIERAKNHYNRWLLFHYFYQWRSLKVVLQLEKAKEVKKARWRQKVWEVLPDYKPPDDF